MNMGTTYVRRLPEQDRPNPGGQNPALVPGYLPRRRLYREGARRRLLRNQTLPRGGELAGHGGGRPHGISSCFYSFCRFVQFDWRQNLFDSLSIWLQPWRQLERFTQLCWRFVNSETGRIRGQFEQHPAWFSKIDGTKVTA